VIVDLTGTQFCDSAGLYQLVLAHKRAAADGGRLWDASYDRSRRRDDCRHAPPPTTSRSLLRPP
jgi:hypothetical protein